jgi:acyl-CoA dehydrogenase
MADFTRTQQEKLIRSSVRQILDDFDRDYWRDVRRTQEFPTEFWEKMGDNGWLGVMIPEEYGGQGLGTQELLMVMEEVGKSEGWSANLPLLLSPVFGGETLKKHGSRSQKEEWLPKLAEGSAQWALGVTEPDAGLNTTNISTTADKHGGEYVVNGRKIWTSGVDSADRITTLVRTLPGDAAEKDSHGFSILLIDPDDPNVDYDRIPMDLYFPDKTYNVYFDGVRVPESALIGEEHQGFHHLFDTLNTERIAGAAIVYSAGMNALTQARDYANEREVFEEPIGSHQAIQHPLADAYADLKSARLMARKAAWQYDEGKDASTASNIANLQAGKAAWNAAEAAMTTFGGMGYSEEVGVGKLWGWLRHTRTAPISEEMLRNYIATHELNLPRSY